MQVSLTAAQNKVLDRTMDFVSGGTNQEHFLISGLAGTGKTTTLIETVNRLKDSGRRVAVCTPTGKAAHVINTKAAGLFTATTLHKVLTARPFDKLEAIHARLDGLEGKAKDDGLSEAEKTEVKELYAELDKKAKKGALTFEPKDPEEIYDEFDTLIFDESSMIGKTKTFDPLIAPVRLKKIFYGDKAQLPPVKDSYGVDLAHADCHLDKILRQGSASGIIPFAHAIHHTGRFLAKSEIAKYPDLITLRSTNPSALKGFEDHQVIVWTNRERRQLTSILREARGFNFKAQKKPYLPMVGEQLMVDENDDAYRLLKGQLVTIKQIDDGFSFNPYLCNVICDDDRGNERSIQISLTDCTEERLADSKMRGDQYADEKARREADRNGLMVMFPYAITCHKAQGSEWDKVFVMGTMRESYADWRKWNYTAATRARKRLVYASQSFGNMY